MQSLVQKDLFRLKLCQFRGAAEMFGGGIEVLKLEFKLAQNGVIQMIRIQGRSVFDGSDVFAGGFGSFDIGEGHGTVQCNHR